ncbi:MAG: hypothetical protein ABJH68_16790 [Ilumatobacter sp.]|uniref:hypothetical protein n=1 Tax=Ilumatobacter sp. TaxID=1967498 RepID=UPI003297CE36
MTGRIGRYLRWKDLMPSTRYSRSTDRTESGTVVPPWPATIARPAAEITCGAPAADVVAAVGAGLHRAGFKVRHTADGFRATFVPWLDVVTLQTWGRTIVTADVRRADTPPATTVALTVVLGVEHSAAKHRCVDGLNQAVGELRRNGVAVSVTDWSPTARP